MNYLKFYNGGNVVRRFYAGGDIDPFGDLEVLQVLKQNAGLSVVDTNSILNNGINLKDPRSFYTNSPAQSSSSISKNAANALTTIAGSFATGLGGESAGNSVNMMSSLLQNKDLMNEKDPDDPNGGLTSKAHAARAAVGLGAASAIGNIADKALMGDKNFGALSEAIDAATHGASSALMKSGNPYAQAVGAGLEVGNFMSKATGTTVGGFDVDIKSSGYGQIGHRESSSSRDFGALIGLGGLDFGANSRKLAERNEQAAMALKAANIADTIKFEQEARMNSVDDVLQQNEIALQGGIDTSLLAAKHGAKIKRIEELKKQEPEEIIYDTPEEIIYDTPEETTSIVSAKNGAKLEQVEVSEEPNVIPEGELHKNKHNLDLEDITKKGIPVGHLTSDEEPETLTEIKAAGGDFVLDAEIESEEVIFSKELTDYIEDARKKWHESEEKDLDLALEVGKRLVKELLMNTEDNTDLISKMEEQL